jgi:hypothetical protein
MHSNRGIMPLYSLFPFDLHANLYRSKYYNYLYQKKYEKNYYSKATAYLLLFLQLQNDIFDLIRSKFSNAGIFRSSRYTALLTTMWTKSSSMKNER